MLLENYEKLDKISIDELTQHIKNIKYQMNKLKKYKEEVLHNKFTINTLVKYKEFINKPIIELVSLNIYKDVFETSIHTNVSVDIIVNNIKWLYQSKSSRRRGDYELYYIENPSYYNTHYRFDFYDRWKDTKTNYWREEYGKEIICITTGEIYHNMQHISNNDSVFASKIRNHLEGKSNYVGVKDLKPMVYRYVEDYNKMSKDEIKNIMNKAYSIFNKKIKYYTK